MSAFDCEIEYLEEDADIVQQCAVKVIKKNSRKRSSPLNVENVLKVSSKSKKFKQELDHNLEYNKHKNIIRRKGKSKSCTVNTSDVKNRVSHTNNNAIIPDYTDPLCLNVKVVDKTTHNLKKVRKWNKHCLEAFKMLNEPLLTESKDIHITRSKRTIILCNVRNRTTGKLESNIYSKTHVENNIGQKNSLAYQSVLPKFADGKFNFKLLEPGSKPKPTCKRNNTIILSKDCFDENSLVVFNMNKNILTNYKLLNQLSDCDNTVTSRYLEEQSQQRICVKCYQLSFNNPAYDVFKPRKCELCDVVIANAHSLLLHLKTHPKRSAQFDIVTQMIADKYKCRICQEQFKWANKLERHLITCHGSKFSLQCSLCKR